LVKDGRTDYKVIPAKYSTITERVMIRPEQRRVRTVPAKYRTETRSVLVSEARGQWVKKKKDPNRLLRRSTSEIQNREVQSFGPTCNDNRRCYSSEI